MTGDVLGVLDSLVPAGMTAGQLNDLIGRLEQAIDIAEACAGIHGVYAAEANAYRRVLQTIADVLE